MVSVGPPSASFVSDRLPVETVVVMVGAFLILKTRAAWSRADVFRSRAKTEDPDSIPAPSLENQLGCRDIPPVSQPCKPAEGQVVLDCAWCRRASLVRCGRGSIALQGLRPSDDPHPRRLSDSEKYCLDCCGAAGLTVANLCAASDAAAASLISAAICPSGSPSVNPRNAPRR